MSNIFARTKTILTQPHLRRSLSLSPPRNKKKNSCEETDCCGNPINVQPKPTIYIERACHPCSFFTWKPKVPILQSAPPLKAGIKKPLKKKHCYAAMNTEGKTLEEEKKEAAQCQSRCDIIKPDCTPPPPPEKIRQFTLQIPEPDWDINGIIEIKTPKPARVCPPPPEKPCPPPKC